MKSSLTVNQKKTLTFIIVTVLMFALAGGMIWDLNRRRAEAATLKREMDRKESEASAVKIPTEAEQEQWGATEKQLSDILLPDQDVPEFLEEVTRLANESKLQKLAINNEDKELDPAKPGTPEDGRLLAVGIHRFLLVTLKFQSEYPDAARFMAGVAHLPRPVEFGIVEIKRSPPLVDVTLTLKVYKQEPAA